MRIRLFVICLSFLLPLPIQAIVLNLNFAANNQLYFGQVESRLRDIKEIQIGGTHKTGNRAVIKVRGQPTNILDPKILIINPLSRQHNERDETVLSVVGDGFDFELLETLHKLLVRAGARVTVIYINNVENNLSLPTQFDKLREAVYAGMTSVSAALDRQIDEALVRYVGAVSSGTRNLYRLYFDMLQRGGNLLFKQAEKRDLVLALAGLFSSHICQPCSVFSMFAERDRVLKAAQTSLQKVGQGAYIPVEHSEGDRLSPSDPYYKVKLQTWLLRKAGFVNCRAGVKKIKGWGWAGDVPEVYSMVIHGTKP